MPVPNVTINKTDGALGVPPITNPTGILALIAPRSLASGPASGTPALATKPTLIRATYGDGLISEIPSVVIPITKKPMLILPMTASTAPAFGAATYVGTGTLSVAVPTAAGANAVDDFTVFVQFTLGGTTGTGPIGFQYSLDSRAYGDPAKVWSGVIQLGSALTYLIPGTGVTLTFITAKTAVTGDYFSLAVTGPRLSDSDVATALIALGNAKLPWEAVLIAGLDASSTTVSNLDTFLAGQELLGKYRMFIASAPLRTPLTQTEAQYLVAQTTLWGSVASARGCVSADGEHLTSPQRGFDMQRAASIPFAAWLLANDVTVDAAQVDLGNLPAVRIVDVNGNPQFHDESLYPGLDDQRLVTLRTINNKIGVFINNPKVISTPGSDYVYAQQLRTMNRACELAFGELTNQLSKGVMTDAVTGLIREDYAQAIENAVNNPILAELGKKVTSVGFFLNRDDVLTPPTANLTGTIKLVMPVYVKGFTVNATFAKTVTVSK